VERGRITGKLNLTVNGAAGPGSGGNMRRYIKRNCKHWGHAVRYTETAIDQNTKKIVGYYGKCSRCSERVFVGSDGGFDSGGMTHLVDITLQDFPIKDYIGQYY
jgi:hypothetical protein